jgi:predicted DNA-binding ribbon-helix-helix protein
MSVKYCDRDRRSESQRAGVLVRVSIQEREQLNEVARERGLSTNRLLAEIVRKMLNEKTL